VLLFLPAIAFHT